MNDTLATSEDLENLFQVLSNYKDRNGKNAVFTAISVVANPDFEKIREAEFNKYFYEPFTETLKRYQGCERSFELWKEGIKNGLFIPQMHGREHLNVIAWMKALRSGDKQTREAFYEGIWGFVPDQSLLPNIDFQAAFLVSDPAEVEYHRKIITEGLNLFENIFGYKAAYFVPPNGPFNNRLNETLTKNEVNLRSASKIQRESIGNGKIRKVIHWVGQKDINSGIRYITRNCFFEPSQVNKNWVDSCLYDIKIAFRWNKPAVISSHRVNYVGALNRENRNRGLSSLNTLLRSILVNWPDVQFMTTPELGELIGR